MTTTTALICCICNSDLPATDGRPVCPNCHYGEDQLAPKITPLKPRWSHQRLGLFEQPLPEAIKHLQRDKGKPIHNRHKLPPKTQGQEIYEAFDKLFAIVVVLCWADIGFGLLSLALKKFWLGGIKP